MDLYVGLAVNILLQLIQGRKDIRKFYRALAKVQFQLFHLQMIDPNYDAAYKAYVAEQAP